MISLFDLRDNPNDNIYQAIQKLYSEPLRITHLPKGSVSACIGCWSCWLKTPGNCVFKDAMSAAYPEYINSDTVILLFDTAQGFIDHHAKAFLDRTIPHYHPYIEMIEGECHHMARYDTYPEMVFFYETEGLTAQEEQLIEDYLWRTAYHYKGQACRITPALDHDLADADKNETHGISGVKIKKLESRKAGNRQLPFSAVKPMETLIIYNGSPRITGSNSGIILEQVAAVLGDLVEVRDLKDKSRWSEWADSFAKDQHVLFFMPLYVHAMPSHVMNFFEKLTVSEGTVSFFVQSGFPESGQSHYLEACFEQLSLRLGRTYLGTAIKGGMEGLQMRPPAGQEKMILPLVQTVENLVKEGSFNKDDIARLAQPVRYGKVMEIMYNFFIKNIINKMIWDSQLKANRAYEKRNDRPHARKE